MVLESAGLLAWVFWSWVIEISILILWSGVLAKFSVPLVLASGVCLGSPLACWVRFGLAYGREPALVPAV